jgi:hypothetical protein
VRVERRVGAVERVRPEVDEGPSPDGPEMGPQATDQVLVHTEPATRRTTRLGKLGSRAKRCSSVLGTSTPCQRRALPHQGCSAPTADVLLFRRPSSGPQGPLSLVRGGSTARRAGATPPGRVRLPWTTFASSLCLTMPSPP